MFLSFFDSLYLGLQSILASLPRLHLVEIVRSLDFERCSDCLQPGTLIAYSLDDCYQWASGGSSSCCWVSPSSLCSVRPGSDPRIQLLTPAAFFAVSSCLGGRYRARLSGFSANPRHGAYDSTYFRTMTNNAAGMSEQIEMEDMLNNTERRHDGFE